MCVKEVEITDADDRLLRGHSAQTISTDERIKTPCIAETSAASFGKLDESTSDTVYVFCAGRGLDRPCRGYEFGEHAGSC